MILSYIRDKIVLRSVTRSIIMYDAASQTASSIAFNRWHLRLQRNAQSFKVYWPIVIISFCSHIWISLRIVNVNIHFDCPSRVAKDTNSYKIQDENNIIIFDLILFLFIFLFLLSWIFTKPKKMLWKFFLFFVCLLFFFFFISFA